MQKRGLGRGLESLIPGASQVHDAPLILDDESLSQLKEISVDKIVANPKQPRKYFEPGAFNELVQSIKEFGLVQPVVVRRIGNLYELVVGERRWRAAKEAGLEAIPAIVRNTSDLESIELALIENLQRQDLNPIEEAHAYYYINVDFDITYDELAKRLGRDRSTINNTVRLLKLSDEIKQMLIERKITLGHGKAILQCPTEELRFKLANRCVNEGLTVRHAEALARQWSKPEQKKEPEPLPMKFRKYQTSSSKEFDARVEIKLSGKNKGKLEIYFKSEDHLRKIFKHLGIE